MSILLTLILSGATTSHTVTQLSWSRQSQGYVASYVESGDLHFCTPASGGFRFDGTPPATAKIETTKCQIDRIFKGGFQ